MAESNVEVSIADIDGAPVNLKQSTGPVDFAKYEELIAKFTVVGDENFALKAEIEVLTKRVRTAEILDSLIKPYAGKAFWFMCIYCGFAGVLLVLCGAKLWAFELPEKVLSLLVGSTAVTVIGLVGMVLTGIFVGARKSGI